jgi:hypothetical protein
MLAASKGKANGKQKITTKAIIYKQAIALTTNPVAPFIQNHPGAMFALLESKWGRMAARYEIEESTTKEPMNALNAV